MVYLVNFSLFRHPAVVAVERLRYFGFQNPLPLLLPLLRLHHNAEIVSKLKYYGKG